MPIYIKEKKVEIWLGVTDVNTQTNKQTAMYGAAQLV